MTIGIANDHRGVKRKKEIIKFLEKKGYKVIRFWNNDIDENIEGVFLEIDKYI